MILHNPAGQGNPYRIDPDQRFPYLVQVGEPFELRFTTDVECATAFVEVSIGGATRVVVAHMTDSATPVDRIDVPQPAPRVPTVASADEGHLAEAAARAGVQADRCAWIASVPSDYAIADVQYRFTSDSEATPWFELLVVEPRSLPASVLDMHTESHVPFDISGLVDQHGVVHEVQFSLPCVASDRIVGFGERFDALNQRGHALDVRVYEQYKGQGARTYLPIPFAHVIGSGWAFWIVGGCSLRIDAAAQQRDVIRVCVEVRPDVAPTVAGRIVRGTPTECLRQFVEAQGGATLPPDWVFSLWLSANEWNTQERVELEARRARAAGIDAGVMVIEAWSDESTFTVFRDAQYTPVSGDDRLRLADMQFPVDGAWPDPKGMVDSLHAQGMRLVLWQIPVLKERGAAGTQTALDWDEAIARNLVVLDESGEPYQNRGFWFHDALLPDFTDEAVRRWWTERRRYLVDEIGVDGFKTDGGEHPWGAGLQYADGTSGAETNNLFPVLYAQAYHELMMRIGVEPVTFSRAGFSGSAAFPAFWAGDEDSTWEALQASVTAGLSAGASGIPFWGFDVGGFSGPIPSSELFLRASAFATLCPIMQLHAEYNHHREPSADRTPWNLAERNGDPKLLEVFRAFAQLRVRLQPYIVAEAAYTVESGRPLMAPLCFDHFADETIWSAPHEYLFGRELLVCPVIEEGAATVSVYLPAGAWTNVWTAERHEGECWLEVLAPIDQIPVFACANGAAWHSLFMGATV